MEQQWVTYNNAIKISLNMADFLWIDSNSNDVIRENTFALFSKGTGEEENPQTREFLEGQVKIVTYVYQLRHKKYAWKS
jgi:hypothetical protein